MAYVAVVVAVQVVPVAQAKLAASLEPALLLVAIPVVGGLS